MDQQSNTTDHLPYRGPYPPPPSTTPLPLTGVHPTTSAGTELAHNILAYQQIQQQLHQQLQENLHTFWLNQQADIEKVCDFKNHSLPLARIKKIMKADEDVRMISAEAPVVFARACEMFILELTMRSWNHTEENKRKTLQKNDIAAAITRTGIFDFLVDIVPREEVKDDVVARGVGTVGQQNEAVPYYYEGAVVQGDPQMVMGRPVVDPGVYGQGLGYMGAGPMWAQQKPPEN